MSGTWSSLFLLSAVVGLTIILVYWENIIQWWLHVTSVEDEFESVDEFTDWRETMSPR